MARTTLLGASGYTGRLVARALDRRGVAFTAAGRDERSVRDAVDGLAHVTGTRRVDVALADTLAAACDDSDVIVTTVGPFERLGRPVLDAAIAHGCHYLDSSGEQPFIRWAFEQRGGAATAAGITAVPAAGFDFLPGDLLAGLAAGALDAPREVAVVYLVRGAGIRGSRGTRRSIAAMIGAPAAAYVDGELVEEHLADHRRSGWFPRPVGPRHAANIPAGEALTVPRHVPTVRTVRTYFAIPAALAELGQLVVNAARWQPIGDAVTRLLTAAGDDPSDEARGKVRWACVAEALDGDGGVARAWAYGHDIYGFTAESMAAVTARLVAGTSRAAGVVAPAEAFDAEDLLDELADATDLRWSVRS